MPQREGQHTEQKKKHVQCACFFAPRAARAHSLTLLFVEMFYRLGPREKDSTPNKKKTRPVRLFFFAPRAARAHSLTLLFVEMFYRLGPREKDSTPNKKKKHVQCAFFFLLPARPGLTHSLVLVVEYYKCWKQKTERTRNKKKQKMARIRSKKKNACSACKLCHRKSLPPALRQLSLWTAAIDKLCVQFRTIQTAETGNTFCPMTGSASAILSTDPTAATSPLPPYQ